MKAFSVCFAFLFSAVPIAAQIVGGEFIPLVEYSSGGVLEGLGYSVSGAGDVDADGVGDYIMSAPGTTANGIYAAGSVFVYSGATGSLLHRFDGELPNYGIGFSVAGAGDFNNDGFDDLMIGVPAASPGGLYGALQRAGSVYIYSGLTGTELHRFDGELASDSLGTVVACAGDVNGDGIDDVIMGATWTTIAGIPRNGTVWVYSGGTGALLYRFDGPGEYSRMGMAVAGAGDINLDGFDDFILSTPGLEINGLPAAGRAMVYSGATGTVLWQFDGTSAAAYLGWSVDTAGDVNQDGIPDVILGAPGSTYGSDIGAAFVYSGATGALLYQFDGDTVQGQMGAAVAGVGDVDGDTVDDLLVGAYRNNSGDLWDAGSVFLYSGATGNLLQRIDGIRWRANMGQSVAGVGDLNGDGLSEFLVGAPASSSTSIAGEVFVYSLRPYLHLDTRSVSLATGGQLDFQLDFPVTASLHEYKILMSQTGSGPSYFGVDIPLTVDQLVLDTFIGNYPVTNHAGMFGTLDTQGDSTASLVVPAGLPPALLGRKIWIAAISNQSSQDPKFSSVVIPITFVP